MQNSPTRQANLTFFFFLMVWLSVFAIFALRSHAQDLSTGAIRGIVEDFNGGRILGARITLRNTATGSIQELVTDSAGSFTARSLPPSEYRLLIEARGMKPQEISGIKVELGESQNLRFHLSSYSAHKTINVLESASEVKVKDSESAQVISEEAIAGLPLNSQRLNDLALLSPGITADSGQVKGSDEPSFGGLSSTQNRYTIDGADANNSFFAQMSGRSRTSFQLSNEAVQEFRVSNTSYAAEQGRAGGSVINIVTKSGSNQFHAKSSYYRRDSTFGATPVFLDFKPAQQQQQFGAAFGGPLRKNRSFFYVSWDSRLLRVPVVVRFANGTSVLMPAPSDYETTDQSLVYLAAASLSSMAKSYPSILNGNGGSLKLDWALSAKNLLTARLTSSRYTGQNNVYSDPSNPITQYAQSENGNQDVSTDIALLSLTTSLSERSVNQLRLQYSRDLQQSTANANFSRTNIDDVLEAFGRSAILPRRTREHKVQLSNSLSYERGRHSWKLGTDLISSWIFNYFPLQFGGQFIFDSIKVNPFTFAPQIGGLELTPLRAYAHQIPRYYFQNFGIATSHPNIIDCSSFLQDSIRLSEDLSLNLGLRYDLEKFSSPPLTSNPLWPASGHLPRDTNNFAPRIAFAYSIGNHHPVIFRGGYGLFFTHIPSIYSAAVETDNGINRQHLFLSNSDFYDHQIFPRYPDAVSLCAPGATSCNPPAGVAGNLTSEISAFSSSFQTPFVQQTNIGLEHEVADHIVLGLNYLYVTGRHLIRTRDANLPAPTQVTYPVFDQTGTTFLGKYYNVDSFGDWQFSKTLDCAIPPCVESVKRPIPALGNVDVFESVATSRYHGFTISARKKMSHGFYLRAGYTWARAMDDGEEGLVVGRPAAVENAYDPDSEYGRSSTDQRQRFVLSWIVESKLFNHDQEKLRLIFNGWKFSGVTTIGSGMPVNARIIGDANRDGNGDNDRLPGVRKNSFTGPDYASSDLRVGRQIALAGRLKMEIFADSFNLLNRSNLRITNSDEGFGNASANFVPFDATVFGRHYPAHYRMLNGFLSPSSSYAPRQVQFGLKLIY